MLIQNTDSEPSDVVDIYGNVLKREDRLRLIEVTAWLPAASKRDDILHAVRHHPVVIVQWETGSGKTTQIPKFLLWEYPKSQIVVMQPRVLSAKSNAHRVALELLAETGNPEYSIGRKIWYRTWPEKSHPWTAPLSFHTDWLELRRQMISWLIPDILISDEAHWFSTASEIVSMQMRERMRTNQKLRTLITSATLDPAIFRNYYKAIDRDIPVIQIPWRTFPVKRILDADSSYSEDIAAEYRAWKNILFFVSGKKEIEDAITRLREILWSQASIFPLHAEMPKEEQDMLLKKDPADMWPRIIVATNVAEESITIPYIDVVIDLANHKVARYNRLGIQGLYLEDTPQSSVKQRAGRAGRTHPGEYRRYNENPHDDLPEYPDAPIEREMLDQYILMFLAEGHSIIEMQDDAKSRGENLFFHEIDSRLLQISIHRLKSIGALSSKWQLTQLGYTLLRYPLDIYHARMLHESIDRGCVAEVMIMVAILEKKWFLSKDDIWKDLGLTKTNDSDLVGYVTLYRFLTSTHITEKQKRKLIELWVDSAQVQDFASRSSSSKAKLYEVVDLSILWIKKARLKAIDDCHRDLTHRLQDLWIPLSESKDARAISTSLATGSIFYRYKYIEEDGGFAHQEGIDQGGGSIFRMGSISLIEPKNGEQYIGQPFIIGGKDGGDGLQLLSFIMHIDDWILKDARLANVRHTKTIFIKEPSVRAIKAHSRDPKKWDPALIATSPISPWIRDWWAIKSREPALRERAIVTTIIWEMSQDDTYMASLESLHEAWISPDGAARDYYILYCLPLFLLEHNNGIKKYISGKSEEWKSIFRELLSRFLIEESHRVKLQNIDRTERSFRYDSGILERFEESSDDHIRYFRTHGVLPQLQKKAEADLNPSEVLDLRIFDLQSEYVRLLWEAKQYRAGIDFKRAQEFLIQFFIGSLNGTNILMSEEWAAAYANLCHAYEIIGDLSIQESSLMIWELKNLARTKDKLKRVNAKNVKIHAYIDLLSKISDQRRKWKSVSGSQEELSQWYEYLKIISISKEQYLQDFARASSSDTKKRKRWANTFALYRDKLRRILKVSEEEASVLQEKLSLERFPEAKTIGNALDTLVDILFEEEYARIRVRPKILDTVREIVRDQATDKKGIDTILMNLFNLSHAWSHIRGQRDNLQQLESYQDILEVIENHQDTVLPEVKSSRDIEYVEKMLERLKKTITRLKADYALLMNNPIYKSI